MSTWPEIPAGYGYPLVTMADGRLPQPVMDAIEADAAEKIADPESVLGAASRNTIVEVTASEAENPESSLNSAIVTIVQEAAPTGLTVVRHADNASYARPTGASQVMWIGTVEPNNIQDGDIWLVGSDEPLPDLTVWTDAFETAGSLSGASTETGEFTWTVEGTGAAVAKASGEVGFTALTSGNGFATVDAGLSDGIFRITATNVGGQVGGVMFRHINTTDHLELAYRTASGNNHYRVIKRVSNTVTTVQELDVNSANGDEIEIVCDGTDITVRINGVQRYNGTITEHATATKFGFTTPSSSLTARWDDAEFEALP